MPAAVRRAAPLEAASRDVDMGINILATMVMRKSCGRAPVNVNQGRAISQIGTGQYSLEVSRSLLQSPENGPGGCIEKSM